MTLMENQKPHLLLDYLLIRKMMQAIHYLLHFYVWISFIYNNQKF